MENVRSFLRGFSSLFETPTGYRQTPASENVNDDDSHGGVVDDVGRSDDGGVGAGAGAQHEAKRDPDDTLSASVNLEDIIDEYDEPSRRSRNTIDTSHYLSVDGGKPSRQSYFSFEATRDDDTTSFYSALHDGFSLNDLELKNKSSGREFLWKSTSSNNTGRRDELDKMLRKSDFQISWIDLTYTIRPRATYADVWEDFKERLTDSASSALGCFNRSRSASYDINGVQSGTNNGSNNINGHGAQTKELDIENGSPRDTITILRNVNGSFRSGQLTAIMGPSGAGKTSLLNILSRRREDGFTGRLTVSETNHRVKINTIPQDDHLLESLTVRENLTYASKLKNPHNGQDHSKNVRGVSYLLGLDDCIDTRTKNISGGQQKRLAIAQELLSKPDILILDEPTSGLDSLTCLKTLSVLKDLVKPTKKDMIDPIAIVLTIHQPQREAFELFDHVYVLANGGIAIYDGPPRECVDFIEKYSGLKIPSADYNPATFLIEIASGEFGPEPIQALSQRVRVESRKRQQRFWPSQKTLLISEAAQQASDSDTLNMNPNSLNNSGGSDGGIAETRHLGRTNSETRSALDLDRISIRSSQQSLQNSQKSPSSHLDPRLVKSSSINTGSFCYKTLVLIQRCWKTTWRDPKQMLARLLFHILMPFGMALIMGTDPGSSNACPIYRSEYSIKRLMASDEYISPDVQEEFLLALENIGVLFVTMYSCISANIAVMTLMFALDMRTCLKEYHNGWYSMNSQVLARIISNIPLDIILPTITVALTYSATGQNTGNNDEIYAYRIILTALVFVLGSMAGQMIGMICGTIYMAHVTTALFASQGATLPFVLLSGFIARTKNMSKFVRTLSYTSIYKHCLEASYIARYGWNVCGCDPTKIVDKPVTIAGVPEGLRKLIKNFMDSQDDDLEPTSTTFSINVTTSTDAPASDDNKTDVFDMVAKQLSLYNTYGIDVKTCDQIVPYEMHDFGLTERDLPASFLALITLLMTMLILLLLVVRLVLNYRTSL